MRSIPLTVLFTCRPTLLTGAIRERADPLTLLRLADVAGPVAPAGNALSRQLGGVGGGGLGNMQGTLGGREQQPDEELMNIIQQQQRELLMDEEKQRAELQRLSPFWQGEDWLVITIDPALSPLSPRRRPRRRRARWGHLRICHRALLGALRSGMGTAAATSAGVTAGGYASPVGERRRVQERDAP